MKRKWLIVGVLGFLQLLVCASIIAVVWIGGQASGGMRFFYVTDTHIVETVEETFTVDGPAILDVEGSSCDANVMVSESDEVEITATLDLWGADEEDARQQLDVQMRQEGNRISVRIEELPRIYVFVSYVNSSRVTFDIRVPSDTALRLETSSGDLEVGDGAGIAVLRTVGVRSTSGEVTMMGLSGAEDVEVDTSAGDVTLQDITADRLAVSSTSGELVLTDLHVSNDAKVKTSAGDIQIEQLSAGSLIIDTSSGEVVVAELDAAGGVDLETTSGDVTLREMKAGSLTINTSSGAVWVEDGMVNGALDLEAISGDITAMSVHASSYNVVASAGGIVLDGCGGPLNVRTVSGDVEIRNCSGTVLDIETSSGSIDFVGSLAAEGEHRVKSSVGEVRIELPVDAAFDLDIQTAHGDIDIDTGFSVTMTRFGERAIEGEVNGGGPLLQIHTRSGSVTLLGGVE